MPISFLGHSDYSSYDGTILRVREGGPFMRGTKPAIRV